MQNLESFRNLGPFDTLMGHAAYVIFCQAVELRQWSWAMPRVKCVNKRILFIVDSARVLRIIDASSK